MAAEGEGNQTGESSARIDSRKTLFRHARLYNFKKSLFNSPFSAPTSDTEPGSEH
jgi:hypothetical protein